jgi:hypothetical protein
MFAIARRLLRPGGLFVAFAPNGSISRRLADPQGYDKSWGRLHPVYLDEEFLCHQLGSIPKLLASAHYGYWKAVAGISTWNRNGDLVMDLSRPELLLACVF